MTRPATRGSIPLSALLTFTLARRAIRTRQGTSMPQPQWTTPAHVVGLPYTNWKRKTGFEMRGTLAQCVQRFLSLPQHHAQNVTLTIEGVKGNWGPASIRAFVAANGVPPQMSPVPLDRLRELTSKTLPEATGPNINGAADAAAQAKRAQDR